MGQVPCMVRVEVEKTQRLQFQVRCGPCICLASYGLAHCVACVSACIEGQALMYLNVGWVQVTVASPDATVTSAVKDLICLLLASV